MTPPGATTRAQITRLSLRNVRTWSQLETTLQPGLTVLAGANGVGKTNLLEALAVGCLGASPRTSAELRIIADGESFARIDADVTIGLDTADAVTHRRVVTYERDRGKQLSIDDAATRSVKVFAEAVGCAVFLPERMLVIRGAAARRRAVIDRLIEQLSTEAADALRRYGKAVQQRNVLLRRAKGGADVRAAVEPWTAQVGELGELIRVFRDDAVARLSAPFASRLEQLTSLTGGALQIERRGASLAEALAESWSADVRRGSTTVGPHLDDIVPMQDGRDLRTWGSTGEQRAALLAWTFADADVLRGVTGCEPILLLDEPWAELDAERRERLTGLLLAAGQVIVTTTEPPQHLVIQLSSPLIDIRSVATGSLSRWSIHPDPA